MNFKEIQELLRMLQKSNIAEFMMEDGEFKVRIRTDKFNAGAGSQPVIIREGTPAPMQVSPAVPEVSAEKAHVHATREVAAPAAEPAPAAKEATGKLIEIKSPMVGTFYRSPSPDKPAYVKVGDVVKAGQLVCIIEAMKLFNEIESEVSGKVVKVMVEDATPVEYDQVLFLLEP